MSYYTMHWMWVSFDMQPMLPILQLCIPHGYYCLIRGFATRSGAIFAPRCHLKPDAIGSLLAV